MSQQKTMDKQREIKFRAINYETQRWVYGYYTKLTDGVRKYDAIISDEDGSLVRYYIKDVNTVGQYIGLKDKNGKDCFFNDIIKLSTKRGKGNNIIGIVVWSNTQCRIMCKFDFRSKAYPLIRSSKFEIIGNKFKNPELLK